MRSTTWLLSGGGLANALLAKRLQDLNEDFVLFEKGTRLFKGQTWSAQVSDVPQEDRKFLLSLASSRWNGYSVRFPDYSREFASSYVTIRSEDLRDKLSREIPAEKIKTETETPGNIQAKFVVRAEGFGEAPRFSGWQKFVGYDVRFKNPHGLKNPLLMDADVDQLDGYRFFYLLPFDSHRLLVEETRYSNGQEFDPAEFAQGISKYIAHRFPANSWTIEREESGALPIPWVSTGRAGHFGVAGGFFQPSTGYSLPQAVRTSRRLIEECRSGRTVAEALKIISAEEQAHSDFYHMLNRMMFLASPPGERRKIFARFYRLGEGLIQRFYSGMPTALDKVRMLTGRPPVKITDAFRALRAEEPVWK